MTSEIIHLMGDEIRLLASTEETAGRLTVVEVTSAPGGGPPLHTHPETEVFLCLEGELEIEVEGKVSALKPGHSATAPSGVAHTYRNTSGASVRFVVSIVPGGFERFFRELAAATASRPPDMAVVAEIAGRHEVRFIGPAPPHE